MDPTRNGVSVYGIYGQVSTRGALSGKSLGLVFFLLFLSLLYLQISGSDKLLQ